MPGDHVDEGGLARAVRADDTHRLLGRNGDVDVVRSDERAESLFQIAHREDVAHAPRLLRKRMNTEPNPPGRNRMVSSSTEPSVICQSPGITSTANERTDSNTTEPMKAAAIEPAPARMVTNTNPPDVVQYAMLGSTWPTVS